jgi:hypothetical protein
LTYQEFGLDVVTLSVTSWDQFGQLKRLIDDVIPRLIAAQE